MIELSVAEVCAATGGQYVPGSAAGPGAADLTVTGGVGMDSREVADGDLFVAVRGVRVDGWDFAAGAHRDGAVAVLAERPVPGVPTVVVADSVVALGALAHDVVERVDGLIVIGITGSSGKTSTKDLLGQLLDRWAETVCPTGSYNNEIGLPLTALRVTRRTRYLVLELGSRGIGHIERLARIVGPQIGIVLNVGSAHLGEFGTTQEIARAKSELLAALPSAAQGGIAVLNADDPTADYLSTRTSARIWRIGAVDDPPTDGSIDVGYADLRVTDGAPSFRLHGGGHDVAVDMRLIGAHQALNATAAAALALAAVAAGAEPPADIRAAATPERLADLAGGLAAATTRSRWRMELTDRADGVTVLNDAYNANPESMRAALAALRSLGRDRRTWAVLGAMGELGEGAVNAHQGLGAEVVAAGVGRLVAVGPEAAGIYAGARAADPRDDEEGYHHVPDISAALAVLRDGLRPGDVVLVKASRAAGLDRLAIELLTDRAGGDR